MKNLGISDLLDLYGEMLTDKQRDVIELYYNQDLSLAEIAEHEEITRQGVRDNIKRGEAFLLEMEEKLHFAEKFKKLVAVTEEITVRCQEIERINKGFTYSQAIDGHARAVRQLANNYLDENF